MKTLNLFALAFTAFSCGHATALNAWGWVAILGVGVILLLWNCVRERA